MEYTWINVPTSDTTSIITTESVSTRKAQRTVNSPMEIHSHGLTTLAFGAEASAAASSTATTKVSPEARLATTPLKVSPRRLPSRMLTARPMSGRKTIQGTRLKI